MRLPNWMLPLMLSFAIVPQTSFAKGDRIELGEVSTQVTSRDLDLPTMLKDAMRLEILTVDLSHATKSAVVSATIIRFERSGTSTICEVSAAIRTKKGNLVAVLSGTARADFGNHSKEALGGAVHGMLRQMPEALR